MTTALIADMGIEAGEPVGQFEPERCDSASFALSRRRFLHAVGGLALGGGFVAANQTCGAVASKPARWVVSCRDLVLRDTGKPDSWSAMNELGLGGVEVRILDNLFCPNLFHPTKQYSVATPDGVKALQEELDAQGVVITAFGLFNVGSELRTQTNIIPARRLVPVAQKMGVRAIRIDVQARKQTSEQFLPFAIQACRQLCEIAEGSPVVFGVENHGKNTNDPGFLERLFDGVGSKHLGLTLDANNFYWYGWPIQRVYSYYEKFALRVVHTHCKSVRYPANQRNVRRQPDNHYLDHSAPIFEGDIDYRRVVAILRKANYQNDLCLENECLHHFPDAQHLDLLKKEVALLKSLV